MQNSGPFALSGRLSAYIIVFTLIAFISIPSVLSQEAIKENYVFITKWGSPTNNALLYAGKVAIDPSGNIYVIKNAFDSTPIGDTEMRKLAIVKYDTTGLPLLEFGSIGEGYAHLDSPADVAVDHMGEHVYVSDRAGKILKFKSDGTFLRQWGSEGSGDGRFSQFVEGIAVDHVGNVYVADAGNSRIQKFSPDGKFLAKWGSDASGNYQFSYPYSIAIAPDDSIYVADPGYRVIKKFASDGGFLLKWVQEPIPDVGGDPIGIAVDSEGSVYVVPQSTGTVRKFTSDGQFISEIGGTTLDPAYLYPPIDVAIDRDGNVYTALQNSGVQKFDNDGNYLSSISITKEGIGGFRSLMGIAVDARGHVFVLDDADKRIQKFAADGKFLSQWTFAVSPGSDARDIVTNEEGTIFLVWEGVKLYTSGGAYIGSLKDSSGGELFGARAVAVDNQYIYVAHPYKIQKFNHDGTFISEWRAGNTGESDGEEEFVDDIAVDSEGRVFALGFFSNIVEVFNGEGGLVTTIDFSSDAPSIDDQRAKSYRIGIDMADDGLYVGFMDGAIRKYDINGNIIAQIASHGSKDGQVIFPTGIAFSRQSELVYVTDLGNSRVQVFGKQANGAHISPAFQLLPDFGLTLVLGIVAAAVIAGIGMVLRYNIRKRKNRFSTAQ